MSSAGVTRARAAAAAAADDGVPDHLLRGVCFQRRGSSDELSNDE